MKVEIGYITSWRRAIFFTIIISIILFGTASTLLTSYVQIGLIGNLASGGVLVLCIGFFILVLSDKWNRYTDIGTADISDGNFVYNDRKRHYRIPLDIIKKVDIEKITIGNNINKPIAYRLIIITNKKKKYIESDRAAGRNYNEVDIHKLYIYIQENISKL